ncbi:MAG: hypothetical protein ACTSPL_04010 [Candidatus Odinarchaeia archaeon]
MAKCNSKELRNEIRSLKEYVKIYVRNARAELTKINRNVAGRIDSALTNVKRLESLIITLEAALLKIKGLKGKLKSRRA